MTVRIGFLGGGLIATYHGKSLRRSGTDATIAAVYDADPERTEAFARASGAAPMASEEAVLDAVDAVYVCTWTSEHPRLVAAAVELGPSGVTVNCICPGPIRTGMTELIPEEAKVKFARRRVPMRRYGDPEEVAQITLSLLLPAASFLTGAVIPVDGGLTVQNT